MEAVSEQFSAKLERLAFGMWAVVLVLALWPLTMNPAEPPKMLATALLVLFCASTACLNLRMRFPANGLGLILVVWLCWLAVCAVFSRLPEHSLRSLAMPTAWVLVALAASRAFREPRHAWQFAVVLVCALAVSSLYGFFQKFGLDPFPWSKTNMEEYRGLPATYGHPNFAGHALVPGIILAVGLSLRRSTRWCVVPALILCVHLYMTHMRAGPIALAAALFLLAIWRVLGAIIKRNAARILATLLVGACVGIIGLAGLLGIHKQLNGSLLPMDSSSILRYNSDYGAARMMLERPLTGIGPGNYDRLNAAWWTPFEQRWYALKGMKNDHVHCEPLEAGAEAGIPGLFLFFLLFCWAFWTGLTVAHEGENSDQRRFGIVAALCAVAMGIDGLLGFNLHVPVSSGIFFVMLGLLGGISGQPTTVSPRAALLRPAFTMLLALLLLAGMIVTFRAETAALYDKGGMERLSVTPKTDPQHTELTNYMLQRLCQDTLSFPDDPRFSELLGRLLLVSGYFDDASYFFQQSLADCPESPETYGRLAEALHGQAARRAQGGDGAGALFLLKTADLAAERALVLCPPLALPHDARWRIADLRAELGRLAGRDTTLDEQEALDEINAALAAGVSNTAPLYRTRTRILQHREETAGAAVAAIQEAR